MKTPGGRVAIKAEVVNRKFVHYLNHPEIVKLALRQYLNLYNNTQAEKLARLIAERSEVSVMQTTKDLTEIRGQLELYRLQLLEQKEQRGEAKKTLSEPEAQEAIKFLQQKNLLKATNELIGKSGIVNNIPAAPTIESHCL